MSRKRKIFVVILLFLSVLLIGIFVVKRYIAHKALPDYNAVIELPGLSADVTVYRDSLGIPHIIAQNEQDLYRATGYVTAQDRFWQMDLLRRVTQGRLSEIFGTSFLDTDLMFRALRIPEKSEEIWKNSPPEVKAAAQAFAEGINDYLAEGNLSFEFTLLGYEPEKWEPQHSVNLIGYMAWSLNSGWRSELTLYKLKNKLDSAHYADMISSFNFEQDVIYPDFSLTAEDADSSLLSAYNKVVGIAPQIFKGSNNWAVAGKKSTSGKPIFANDMHLGLMIPGVWSQIHQIIPDKLNVTGVILPGTPFVVAGHNENIAWGMTNVMIDDIDFYAETINPDNPDQYKFNGEWCDMIVKIEKIKDKKGNITERKLRFTHRGPVVNEMKGIKNKVISMHWLGNESSNELLGVYNMNYAKNYDDYLNACKDFISVSQNIAYADTQGNIALHMCAGLPVRKAAGYSIFPGETDEYDWKEFVPFDSLPHVYNPDCGYVYSANNRTAPKDYPYYISAWYHLPNRAQRIGKTLAGKEKLSVRDFKDLQNNQVSILAEKFVPVMLKEIPKMRLDAHEQQALEYIERWNFDFNKDSVAPLLFEKFYILLAQNMLKDEIGDTLYPEFIKFNKITDYILDKAVVQDSSIWSDDITTDKKESLSDMMLKSFQRTVGELTNNMGTNIENWKWGDAHHLALEHPIGKNALMDFIFNLNRTYRVGGASHTVSPYSFGLNPSFTSKTGASHRHIYTLGNFDASQSIIPTGVSGIPSSEHYCDQSEDYVNGVYHADYFSQDAVEKHVRYKTVFKPQK